MSRLTWAPLPALIALSLVGCGGGTTTVTQTQTATSSGPPVTTTTPNGATVTVSHPRPPAVPAGNHGPHYFETPSHNIGCYIDAQSARCDIRERSWTPPPKPQYCIKAGVDWGGGVAVAAHRASIVCAGDTVLGGPGLLPYRSSAQRGTILCVSRVAGMTCRNTATAHGFFLSRASYRLF
jgi:uncharacterized protein DUF6636